MSTGSSYVDENGDTWHRVPPFGCWERDKDRAAWNSARDKCVAERRAKRNANRVAAGKRPKSKAQFDRATERYSEYVQQDSALTFGEWLKAYHGSGRRYREGYW